MLVDAGKIIDIKSQNEIQIPPHAKVMDFKQCTLLPGLIDSHVHLVMDASADPVANLEMTAEELLQRMQANAKTLWRTGVTTGDSGGIEYLDIELRTP